jgi:CRISPR/Cas system CSM-associated protein Csm3 (group 7 of RAMP superfamily)
MLKDSDGWPYIPASTLKGKLRHATEQVLSTILSAESAIDPHENRVRKPIDAVSIIFGTPWQPGLAIFEDLKLVGPPPIMQLKARRGWPRTTERTSVSVNRRRRVAADQRLFRTEVLLPGTQFQFGGRIRGDLTKGQAGLLAAGLRLIPAMGGGKSGGLGWVSTEFEITIMESHWSLTELLEAVREER